MSHARKTALADVLVDFEFYALVAVEIMLSLPICPKYVLLSSPEPTLVDDL